MVRGAPGGGGGGGGGLHASVRDSVGQRDVASLA